MSEPNELGCRGLADVAAELALGVLTGRERAQAIAHLEQCEACREHVRRSAVTGEQLLELLPGAEPPPGFETRVLDRLGIQRQGRVPAPRARWTRWTRPALPVRRLTRARSAVRARGTPRARGAVVAAGAAVIVVACGFGGWGLRGVTAPPSPAAGSTVRVPLRSASLVTAGRDTVGTIFLYAGNPRWLYMSVDMGSRNGTVICHLETRGGGKITVGSFQLTGGYGYWGSPAPATAAPVTGARLTTAAGTLLATASFRAAW